MWENIQHYTEKEGTCKPLLQFPLAVHEKYSTQIGDERRVLGWALRKTTSADMRTQGRKVVCSGQGTEKGAREVVYVVFRYAVDDRKGKKRVEKLGKEGSGLMGAQRGQNWYSDKGSVAQWRTQGFLRSFRKQMRGFHDVLRQRPSSLFILLRWS
jgi:hypothetical protein